MSEVDRVVMGIRHVDAAARGRPVPPGVRADAGRPAPARELPPPGRARARRAGSTPPSGRSRRRAWPRPTRADGTAEPATPSRPPRRTGRGRPMSEEVRTALAAVVDGRTLSMDEARAAMGSVMDGEATPAQLAALLVALRMRGETVEELAGFASAMRERVLRVDAPDGAIDVVGTGGDGSGTFNISTTAALVVAAAGVAGREARQPGDHVALRLGRRARRARRPDRPRRRVGRRRRSASIGFAFLFAPGFHPAMKHAGPDPPRDRRPDGVQPDRPADEPGRRDAARSSASRTRRRRERIAAVRRAARHRAGVRRPRRRRRRAAARRDRRAVRRDARTAIERRTVDAAALGLAKATTAKLAGGTAAENATIIEAVLRGEPRRPPRRRPAQCRRRAARRGRGRRRWRPGSSGRR